MGTVLKLDNTDVANICEFYCIKLTRFGPF